MALCAAVGLGGSLLRPLLTSDRHQRGLRTRGPAFRASPTHRYANRISPDKGLQNEPPLRFASKQRVVSLPKLSIYLPTAISSSVSRCHARSPGIAGLMKFLLVVWQVLARMWLTTSSNNRFCKEVRVCQLDDTFAGFLPTGCYRTAVALASYSI